MRARWIGAAIICFAPFSQAFAFGSSKPKPPVYSEPNPLRYVVIRPIQNVSAFETPNQVTTSADQVQTALSAIIDGVATNSGFSVIQGNVVGEMDPCGQHLELWPTITDFVLDDSSINVQFGFNSGGLIQVGQPSVLASDTITMESVMMEFTLYRCDNSPNGTCTSLVASDADQTALGTNFSFNVNWGVFNVSGSLLTQVDLTKALQSIMISGIKKLVSSPQMASVPWSTVVTSVNSDGSFTILGGENANIGLNQYFTISSRASSQNQCGVSQALACAFSSEVDNSTSVLKVYQTLSQGQGVRIVTGDLVQVGSLSCPTSPPGSLMIYKLMAP